MCGLPDARPQMDRLLRPFQLAGGGAAAGRIQAPDFSAGPKPAKDDSRARGCNGRGQLSATCRSCVVAPWLGGFCPENYECAKSRLPLQPSGLRHQPRARQMQFSNQPRPLPDSILAQTTVLSLSLKPQAPTPVDRAMTAHITTCVQRTRGRTTVRKTLIQCQNPNCGTRHVALLQNEPPPAAPRCIKCDTPLPPTVEGEFVYFAVSPSTTKSRAIESQAAPDLTAAMPRAIAPLTCARPAKMAPLLIVKSLQQSFKSRWQRIRRRDSISRSLVHRLATFLHHDVQDRLPCPSALRSQECISKRAFDQPL